MAIITRFSSSLPSPKNIPWRLLSCALANSHHLSFKQTIGNSSTCIITVRACSLPSPGEYQNASDVKTALYQALQGVDRGIFGITSVKKTEVESLVEMLESLNPTPEPTSQLQEKVDGCWKLVYSTITILGSKRTKLGLRGFIDLGDFMQIINVSEEKAVNVIRFNAKGFSMLNGQLKIVASYKISSKSRVDITLESSSITPDQLMGLFEKNYDLLLNIFNPEGWLEITYVDESLRIGRDDKKNIFVLERSDQTEV